jgi:hypothetical protein
MVLKRGTSQKRVFDSGKSRFCGFEARPWVAKQRSNNKNNKLGIDRKGLLDKIGFAWKGHTPHNFFKPDDKLWHQQHEKLVEHKQKKGHCFVSRSCKQDKSLGLWIVAQRASHANLKMRPDRKELLDDLDFIWISDNLESEWNEQHEKLVEFKQKKGHCFVPRSDKSLGLWVMSQRARHASFKMPPDRKEFLDQLGFGWRVDELRQSKWNEQWEKLIEFKTKNGHCVVPQKKNKDGASLRVWVGHQRQCHAKNKMRQNRKELLDELDFVWKADSHATRSSTTDADSGQMTATRTRHGGKDTGSCKSVEGDGGGRHEEDSNPSLVMASGALLGSHPDQKVLKEEATTLRECPHGWTRAKLEPDC